MSIGPIIAILLRKWLLE